MMELCEVCKLPAEIRVLDRVEEVVAKATGGWERNWSYREHHFCRAHARHGRAVPLPLDPNRRCGIESGG